MNTQWTSEEMNAMSDEELSERSGIETGTRTFKFAVMQNDWEAVARLLPLQRTAHGEHAVSAEDKQRIHALAAQGGVSI